MNIRTIPNSLGNSLGVTTERNDDEVQGKVIRNCSIAREIIRAARNNNEVLNILDLKPDRNDPDKKRTVVVFENNETFQKYFTQVLREIQDHRSKRDNAEIDELKKQIEELKKLVEVKE